MSGESGDWMQTNSGRRFYPMDPRSEDMDPADIAHALSQLCRYGGHVDRFYSVAEHCVLLSYAVAPENAMHALLHDATEAYVVDVPRPVKRYLSDYKDIEDRVWLAIAERFGVSPEVPAEVWEGDSRIILNERAALLKNAEFGNWAFIDDLEPLIVPIFGWLPGVAERKYAKRLEELLKAKEKAAA